MKDNFQQWISWLLHRWRTQRNAIRNVNCRSVTHRNFERTLHLVAFRQVCLFECLCKLSLLSSFPTIFLGMEREKGRGCWSLCVSAWKKSVHELTLEYLRHLLWLIGEKPWSFKSGSLDCLNGKSPLWFWHFWNSRCFPFWFLLGFTGKYQDISAVGMLLLLMTTKTSIPYTTIWTSNQARLPAELKHINKRRKRN